jgi:hypothetical protein
MAIDYATSSLVKPNLLEHSIIVYLGIWRDRSPYSEFIETKQKKSQRITKGERGEEKRSLIVSYKVWMRL